MSSFYTKYNIAYQTVDKNQQIILIYDGIIKHLNQLITYLETQDAQNRYNHSIKIVNIINGLQASLDTNICEKMAKILYDFYQNMAMRITDLNITNDAFECQQIIKEFKAMRGTWQEAIYEHINRVNNTISASDNIKTNI